MEGASHPLRMKPITGYAITGFGIKFGVLTSHLPLLVHAFDGKVVLSIDEVAEVLGCSVSHLYNQNSLGTLPFKLIKGGAFRVSVLELANFLDGQLSLSKNLLPDRPEVQPVKSRVGRPRKPRSLNGFND